MSALPPNRTSMRVIVMSALCQKRTHAVHPQHAFSEGAVEVGELTSVNFNA